MAKTMKYLKYILPMSVISLIFLGVYIYRSNPKKDIQENEDENEKRGLEEIIIEIKPPHIFFIPGFKSKGVSIDEYSVILKEVFPESEIEIMKWESGISTRDWDIAIDNAELFAGRLFERIEKMEPSKRANLVLIGHSLGGRITIRTLAKLANQNIRIRRGIFLGAAIPDNDSDISKAIIATSFPCINIYSRDYYVLRNIYGTIGENDSEAYMKCALGAYGSRIHYPYLSMLEFKADFSANGVKQDDKGQDDKYNNHLATKYILELRRYLNDCSINSVLFPPMAPRRWSLEKDTWEKVNQTDGWTLYKHVLSMQHKIVSPWGNVSVLADEKKAMMEYERLQENLRQVQKYNSLTITVENEDTPLMKVIPTPGIELWKTEEESNGWLLQCNVVGTYRIIDAHDFQRAHGKKTQMKRVFENIKAQFQE